ncbi:MAG: glycosyltransferase [Alphaproteobacteria bacterium]
MNGDQAWQAADSRYPSPGRARVAVLLPCLDEAQAIAEVVGGFRAALPEATVYVYDNGSADDTAVLAAAAGAVVRREPRRGKGNVVRRMFADVEAEIYVLVDGDGTYDAPSAPAMIAELRAAQLDMVVGARVSSESTAYRAGHVLGNKVLTRVVGALFGSAFDDVLSGYRVLSRRLVKSFPALSHGFEIEAELAIHALSLGMPVAELPTPYRARPVGSESKLRTYRDGARILLAIFKLVKEERPLFFFSSLFALLALGSLAIAYPVVVTYLATGLVPRIPTAVLCTGLMILAFLSLSSGFILDTVTRGRREMKRLAYLANPPPE